VSVAKTCRCTRYRLVVKGGKSFNHFDHARHVSVRQQERQRLLTHLWEDTALDKSIHAQRRLWGHLTCGLSFSPGTVLLGHVGPLVAGAAHSGMAPTVRSPTVGPFQSWWRVCWWDPHCLFGLGRAQRDSSAWRGSRDGGGNEISQALCVEGAGGVIAEGHGVRELSVGEGRSAGGGVSKNAGAAW